MNPSKLPLAPRQSNTNAIGFLALVSLNQLSRVCQSSNRMHHYLSGQEIELWLRARTEGRRREFLGGRLAAKLAFSRCREDFGYRPLGIAQIEITRSIEGRPAAKCVDGMTAEISISHTHNWAIALATVQGTRCSVDIEDCQSRVRCAHQFFHPTEVPVVSQLSDTRTAWVLKEAFAKLRATGLMGNPHSILLFKRASSLFLAAVTARQGVGREITLYAGSHEKLAMGIALVDA